MIHFFTGVTGVVLRVGRVGRLFHSISLMYWNSNPIYLAIVELIVMNWEKEGVINTHGGMTCFHLLQCIFSTIIISPSPCIPIAFPTTDCLCITIFTILVEYALVQRTDSLTRRTHLLCILPILKEWVHHRLVRIHEGEVRVVMNSKAAVWRMIISPCKRFAFYLLLFNIGPSWLLFSTNCWYYCCIYFSSQDAAQAAHYGWYWPRRSI